MKILIVDDDAISRKMLRSILSGFGHCDMASDGADALDSVLQAINEKSPYDLITLDISMPDIDGQECLKRIRALEESKGILGLDQSRIIMATGKEDSRSIMTAFTSGCEDYVVKPFDRDAIEAKVRKLFAN